MGDKYTLITGGTKGIGYEFAKLFAKDGKNIFLIARHDIDLANVKKELEVFKVKVLILKVDLVEKDSVDRVLNFIEEKNIEIENLVNNAGIGTFGYFDEIEEERDVDLIDVNIYALTKLIKRLLPAMRKRGKGGILNVASTAAFVGGPKMSTYYSSKAYVLTLSEALYEENREFGVNISCVCPGPVKTGFQENAGIVKSEKAKKYLMDAKDVAKEGYEGFIKGKAIIIPGFKNKIMVVGTKFLPRSMVRKIIFNTNK